MKSREMLETPKSLRHHSMTREGECEGLKRRRIGQSAAHHLGDEMPVQRLEQVILYVG